MDKGCGCKLKFHFKMLSWLVCIACLMSIRQNSFTAAHFSSTWVSSPNISPLDRLLYTRNGLHSTCPLAPDGACNRPPKVNSCSLALDDIPVLDNVSSLVENTIEETEGSLSAPGQPDLPLKKPDVLIKVLSPDGASVPPILSAPEQPPIATFDEWTKEKLKMEEKKKTHQHRPADDGTQAVRGAQNGSPHTSQKGETVKAPSQSVSASATILQEPARRNYASKECGAKVLFSNDEAENRNAVLNEKEADDYMRNPCERAQQKWLVFELCETVQPTALEIANFELFSSGPRDIRLSASERYPSNDWVVLGEFQAEDARSVQRFPVTTSRIYAKFIRLELLTHHGREHYCTLSLVRLFGISMVDEYEAEAEAASAPILDSVHAKEAPQIILEGVTTTTVMPNPTIDNGGKEQKSAEATEISSSSKQKDRHIVDTVVDVMGTIGIVNIKNVIESAFLGSWKNKRSSAKWSNTSVIWVCRTCPAPGATSISCLFCRAFFQIDCPSFKKWLKKAKAKSISNYDVLMQNVTVTQPPLTVLKKTRINRTQKHFLSIVVNRSCPLRKATEEDSGPKGLPMDFVASEGNAVPSPPVNVVSTPKPSASQTLPGGTMSHKESVFLKLNKRISALELNISLSSEYLSELSRRYVEQTNESQKQTEKTLKLAETAANNAIRGVKFELEPQIKKLSREVKELTKLVNAVAGRVLSSESALERSGQVEKEEKLGSEYIEPPCNLNNDDSTLTTPRPQLLYSNDHMWTTEQLIYMVVLAQGCTVALMILAQCYYNGRRTLEVRSLRTVIDEQILKAVAFRSEHDDTSTTNACSQSSKRKPNRQKKSLVKQTILGDQESTVSSSLLSVASPPLDDVSEVEVGESAHGMNKRLDSTSKGKWDCIERPTKEGWRANSDDYFEKISKSPPRCASAEELSINSSELSSEQFYGHSSDELQRTPQAKNYSHAGFSRSTPSVSPEWQVVGKRRRKKLEKSPFKRVL